MYCSQLSHTTSVPRVCWGAIRWVLLNEEQLPYPMHKNTINTISISKKNHTSIYVDLYTSTLLTKKTWKLTILVLLFFENHTRNFHKKKLYTIYISIQIYNQIFFPWSLKSKTKIVQANYIIAKLAFVVELFFFEEITLFYLPGWFSFTV